MSALTTPLVGHAFFLVSDHEGGALAAVEAKGDEEALEFADALRPALDLPGKLQVKQVGRIPEGVQLFRLRYLEALTTRAVEERRRSGATSH